jgi:hypothetical protein
LLALGKPPIVMPITGYVASDRIKMQINYPWVRPDSVRKWYAWAGVIRKIELRVPASESKKTRALLDFVADTPNLTHGERFTRWNKAHPQWRYENVDSFRSAWGGAKRRSERRR